MYDPDASPINPLPPVIVALAVVIAGIELLFSLGARGIIGGAEAVGWRVTAIQGYGFFGQILAQMVELGVYPAEHLVRFVTYPLIHASFTHALFVIVFTLALGKMVAEIFSAWSVLMIFFGSAVIGALVYGLALAEPVPLIGGFPAVYGLIGAYTFLLWIDRGARGENRLGAFSLIAFLLGIQLLFGLLFGGGNDWLADIVGFATGFLLSFVVSPGGWSRVLDKLRRR